MNIIYADPKGNALISCPYCGRKREANVSKHIGRELVIKCNCGQTFACRFECEDSGEKEKHGIRETDQRGSTDTAPLVLHADTAGGALFTCPNCGFEKEVKSPGESSIGIPYRIRCRCGETYTCRFEPPAIENPEQKQGEYFPLKEGISSPTRAHVYTVGENGKASIVCQKCGIEHLINPKDDALLRGLFWLRCKCGHTSLCRIEQRRHFRKKVDLKGTYINRRTGVEDYTLIEDISLGGISLVPFKGKHPIVEGDILNVVFNLDDEQRTVINRMVRVKNVYPEKVGCEFLEIPLYDKELGFYLLS